MQKGATRSAFEHVLQKTSTRAQRRYQKDGTKQDRAGKAAARKHSVNILVEKEITKERTCLLGRKARKLPTDVAKEVVSTIFTLLIRIN